MRNVFLNLFITGLIAHPLATCSPYLPHCGPRHGTNYINSVSKANTRAVGHSYSYSYAKAYGYSISHV